MKALDKYKSLFVENESTKGLEFLRKQERKWSSFTLVPCRNEYENLFSLVNSLENLEQPQSIRPLYCFILNAVEKCPQSLLVRNRKAIRFLNELGTRVAEFENFSLIEAAFGDIIIMNFSKEGHFFPTEMGVGLARKIGADLGFQLKMADLLSCAFIFSTDADAILPKDYLSRIESLSQSKNISAYHYDFRHDVTHLSTLEAISLLLYELHLRYYQAGLQWAESTYSHYSIGSCLALHYEFYAKTRGFPKLLAGEDFYLLNKMSKLAPILHEPNSRPIILAGDLTTECPFGTASSVSKIKLDFESSVPFKLYHPQIFHRLKGCLSRLRDMSKSIDDLAASAPIVELGLSSSFQKIDELQYDEVQRVKQRMDLFDAFYQLKFIHFFTKKDLPKREWKLALDESAFQLESFDRWEELYRAVEDFQKMTSATANILGDVFDASSKHLQ